MNGQRLLITWDTITPEGIIEYTEVNVAFSGTIIDFHHVVGTWHDYKVRRDLQGKMVVK
ncbi:MAG: hypothetical protein K8R63_12230 [Bacteroidales bacterium]|nr:hypothetical protein [Bacteroidales bacterium]